MTERPKLVIIGANAFQNRLILKAQEMGYETHVFAWQDGSIGETTADFFYPISIVETEEILNACKKIKPVGVVSIGSDLAVVTVNFVAGKLGLICNDADSTINGTNKYEMRKMLCDAGCSVIKFAQATDSEIPDVSDFRLPLIVKPTDRSGSRGVTKITDLAELPEAVSIAIAQSLEKKAIIEEFVEGDEYSIEYISHEGKHIFLAITKKYTTGAPNFIELGHIEPSGLEANVIHSVKAIVEKTLNVLGMMYGASHTEVKIGTDGHLTVIESGLRMGGDFIGSDLVPLSTGYDYVGNVIRVACGLLPESYNEEEKGWAVVRFIFSSEDLAVVQATKEKHPDALVEMSEDVHFDGRKILDSSERYGHGIFFSQSHEIVQDILMSLGLPK